MTFSTFLISYHRVFQNALKEVATLEDALKGIKELSQQLALYFCEDEKDVKIQDILKLFKTFSDQLTKAKQVFYWSSTSSYNLNDLKNVS